MSTKDLLAHQARNRERTIDQINNAVAVMEKEIKELGYYPENKGRVTVKEVCQRAGVGYSTLKNPAHKATLKRVKDWLSRLKKVAPTAKADADVIKRKRTNELIEQVETIACKFNRFKIEYDMLLEDVGTLQDRITDLETENASLRHQNASLHLRIAEVENPAASGGETNVIPFPT